MQLINAVVKKAPRQVTTKYGTERIVFDAVSGNDEITIWRPATDSYLLDTITRGDDVTIGIDSKGKYHLIEDGKPEAKAIATSAEVTETVTETAKKHDSTISDDTKREIARYVKDMADLYGFCLKSAGGGTIPI